MSHPDTDALFDHVRAEDTSVAEHAASCDLCREELAAIRAMVAGARAIEPGDRLDHDDAIAFALSEVPDLVSEPVARPFVERPWRYGLAAAACIAVGAGFAGGWFAHVEPEAITATAFDAVSGVLVAEVAPGSAVSFSVPVRISFGERVTVEFDASSTFAVLDLSPPEVALRLDDGAMRWFLVGPPDHTLLIATTGAPMIVHEGTGELRTAPVDAPPATKKPAPRLRSTSPASDVRLPDPPPIDEPAPLEVIDAPLVVEDASPTGPDGLYRIADRAIVDGETDLALELLDEIAARFPGHPSARLALFDRARLIERTNPAGAAEAWRRFLALGPGDALYETAEARLCRVEPAAEGCGE